ncbi:MAG TPA: L,D-transpeptidase/peptidoglycan binding protein [Solirubrobacteraceae bacterium]|nr:L,D-transpeptidase/peptidoglycan binding protein [Solirubrobacteraceae bacterium]
MTRARLLLAVLVVLVPVALFATLAFADAAGKGKIADGVSVEGVDVGGLTQEQAIARVYRRLRDDANRPVRVRIGDERFALSTQSAGMTLGLDEAVRRAYEEGRGGNVVVRGWRSLTGGSVDHDEDAKVMLDRDRVRAFVANIHDNVSRAAINAELTLEVDRVAVSKSSPGRRLADREGLVRRVTDALLDPRADRTLTARTEVIDPDVTEEDVWERNPVVVTVSRAGKTARLFERGTLVRSYRVAVGEPKYPTPMGSFVVQGKQVDPPWNVPDSDWAGKLAGTVVPGGAPENPLKARWIGFNGSVGFHGTASVDSLGRAASHGCVRMAVPDVIDLYDRVEVGTPVLVGP